MQTILKVNLTQVARALRLGFIADLVLALWGPTGGGKSSIVAQSVPDKWKLFDFRSSDKEASDVGGIPYPVETKDGRSVEYLLSRLLPFDTDEKCIVFLDEFDRCEVAVQNAMLQVVLDRSINGHKLSKNARLVIAGNGSTDTGTIPLSSAAATRMVHLYIETQNDSAIKAWQDWARGQNVSPYLQSFSEYKSDVWCSRAPTELVEYGTPTPRTFVMADRLWQATKQAQFETADIILPLMAGCVGAVAAREMLSWYKLCESAPTIEEITRSPRTVRLPDQMGVYFALGLTLARHAKGEQNGTVDAFAQYIARWQREQARFAFTHLLREQPRAATSPAYLSWEKQQSAS